MTNVKQYPRLTATSALAKYEQICREILEEDLHRTVEYTSFRQGLKFLLPPFIESHVLQATSNGALMNRFTFQYNSADSWEALTILLRVLSFHSDAVYISDIHPLCSIATSMCQHS